MNKQEAALRVMRALHDAGYRKAVDRRNLDLTTAAVLDIVDKRALRGWRFYLEAKGYAVPGKGGIYRLAYPVSLELEAFAREEK